MGKASNSPVNIDPFEAPRAPHRSGHISAPFAVATGRSRYVRSWAPERSKGSFPAMREGWSRRKTIPKRVVILLPDGLFFRAVFMETTPTSAGPFPLVRCCCATASSAAVERRVGRASLFLGHDRASTARRCIPSLHLDMKRLGLHPRFSLLRVRAPGARAALHVGQSEVR